MKNLKISLLLIVFTIQFSCGEKNSQEINLIGRWELISITPTDKTIQKDPGGLAAFLYMNISAEGTIWEFQSTNILISKDDSVLTEMNYKITDNIIEISDEVELEKLNILKSNNDLTLTSIEEGVKVDFKLKN